MFSSVLGSESEPKNRKRIQMFGIEMESELEYWKN